MPADIVSALLNHGTWGIAVSILLYFYSRKDQELTEERHLRLKDAQDFRDQSLQLAQKVFDATDRLSAVADAMTKKGSHP